EYGEERLFVRDFARQRVGHADGARCIGFHQRVALGWASENVVDQHATVQQIDLATLRFQILAVELEIAWIAHDRGHALTFKARLQDFELAPSRDFAPIHNPDDWWR